MAEIDLYSEKDGENFRVLANGLEIIRHEKHEWRSPVENEGPEFV